MIHLGSRSQLKNLRGSDLAVEVNLSGVREKGKDSYNYRIPDLGNVEVISSKPEKVEITIVDWEKKDIPVVAVLPRICFDREMEEMRRLMGIARDLGVTEVLLGNLGFIVPAKEMGFDIRGDFGLQVFNGQASKEYKRMGFKSLTASFELKLAQIRDLTKAVDTEMIAYGRLPLMITENCAIKNQSGKCVCSNVNTLTDRKGVRFPVVKAWGCRNEILNANKLWLADKAADYKRAGLWAVRLSFTTENGVECAQVLESYRGMGNYTPNGFTRGLYYRDVE